MEKLACSLIKYIALRAIKCKIMKGAVWKVVNHYECASCHQILLGLFGQAQVPKYSPSLSTALQEVGQDPSGTNRKSLLIAKIFGGRGE